MQPFNDYSIGKESFDDMRKAGRFNRSLEITFRLGSEEYTHKLSAGYGDDISVYSEDNIVLVLSRNSGLGYAGLEAFEKDGSIGDMFLEQHQVDDIFGDDGIDEMEDEDVIQTMRQYIEV